MCLGGVSEPAVSIESKSHAEFNVSINKHLILSPLCLTISLWLVTLPCRRAYRGFHRTPWRGFDAGHEQGTVAKGGYRGRGGQAAVGGRQQRRHQAHPVKLDQI